jgi:hypothetical protein
MTCQAIADLPGVDHSTISVITRHIAGPLRQHGTAITPGPDPIRTLASLRRHAAAAGLALPGPPATAHAPAGSTVQAPDTPQTHIILERLQSAG